jgi:hypothetical protein
MARRKSELLVGNGAADGDWRFPRTAACLGEESKRAILFQVIFSRARFRLFFRAPFGRCCREASGIIPIDSSAIGF